MAAWFSVYCTHSVSEITADNILTALRDSDMHMVAESFNIDDDEAIEAAVNGLQIELIADQSDVRFRVLYRPPEFRPIIVHVWSDPTRVKSELKEAAEQLELATGSGISYIKAHFEQVLEVVAVEFGWSQMRDLGVVFANQVAEYFARVANGVILDEGDCWWMMDGVMPIQIASPDQ